MKVFVHHNDSLILEATVLNEDLHNGGEIYIGRDDDCHIQLNSHKISRHHAIIFYEDEKLKVKSLSQFNKVKIQGREVDETTISNGSQISIDDYVVTVDKFELSVDPEDIPSEVADSLPDALTAFDGKLASWIGQD